MTETEKIAAITIKRISPSLGRADANLGLFYPRAHRLQGNETSYMTRPGKFCERQDIKMASKN